jgi:hypothetical protein
MLVSPRRVWERDGFKPGPLGDPGLGQLAYDKKMRILAASSASDAALESGAIQHGLLTYSLIEEGFKKMQADWQPRDGKITIGEWLAYSVQRVPQLADDLLTGKIRGFRPRYGYRRESTVQRRIAQQPSVYDFTGTAGSILRSGGAR